MFCPNCGYETDVKNQFCPNCGKNLNPRQSYNQTYNEKPEVAKWVKTCALVLFIVSLVVFIFNFLFYGMYVGMSTKDFLFIGEYFKPIYFLIPIVIGAATIVFGGVCGKRDKGVKSIVIGILLTVTSFLTLVTLLSIRVALNNSYNELTANDRTAFDQVAGGLPIIREEQVIYSITEEDGETYSVPVYTYLKFTDEATANAFTHQVDSSSKWKKGADQSPQSSVDLLIFNVESNTYFDLKTPGIIIFMIYNRNTSSMAIFVGDTSIITQFAQYAENI